MRKLNKVVRTPNKNTLMATVSCQKSPKEVDDVPQWRNVFSVLNPKIVRRRLSNKFDRSHRLSTSVDVATVARDLSHVPFASVTLIHC